MTPIWFRLGFDAPGPYWRLQARAHSAVRRALSRGELTVEPCARANEGDCAGRMEAHHEDYERELDVVWLCRRHHLRLHSEQRAAEKAAA